MDFGIAKHKVIIICLDLLQVSRIASRTLFKTLISDKINKSRNSINLNRNYQTTQSKTNFKILSANSSMCLLFLIPREKLGDKQISVTQCLKSNRL